MTGFKHNDWREYFQRPHQNKETFIARAAFAVDFPGACIRRIGMGRTGFAVQGHEPFFVKLLHNQRFHNKTARTLQLAAV